MNKYHSGKFCPIIKSNCRVDCVALCTFDECALIDSQIRISKTLDEILIHMQQKDKYDEPIWGKP